MDNETKYGFIKYRLEESIEACESAKVLYDKNDFRGATNRAYYAIFYAIRAILAMEEIDFKRHKDVIAYFNKNYVNKEIFPKKLGRKISQAKKLREDSDYDDKFRVDSEKTKIQIETAEELIKLVEEYIKNNIDESEK